MPDIHTGYAILILSGLVLMALLPTTSHFPNAQSKRAYYRMQLITAAGAVLGAKLAVMVGDAHWPLRPFDDWHALLVSGRSIAGALLFGFITVEIAKPLLKYELPPNDRFAINLALTIAVGRIGCVLAGCCRGIPYNGAFATSVGGVSRFPAQLLEVLFHLSMAAALYVLWRRKILFARLFALYLVSYGLFRFVSEFWRDTGKVFGGLSGYQLIAFLMILTGCFALVLRRTSSQPVHWAKWRTHDFRA